MSLAETVVSFNEGKCRVGGLQKMRLASEQDQQL